MTNRMFRELVFWGSTLGLIVILAMMGARGAGATIIDEGAASFVDDTTNLRWLKSSETVGLSYLQASVAYPTFRHATGDEVCALLGEVGTLVPSPCPGAAVELGDGAGPFASLTAGGTAALFLYDDENGAVDLVGLAAAGLVGAGSVASVEDDAQDSNTPAAGVAVAMVQVVPEPITGAMLGTGLLMLGLCGGRRPCARSPSS